MDFDVIGELKQAAEAIHFSKIDDSERGGAQADKHKTEQRRDFATLVRSIKSLMREDV